MSAAVLRNPRRSVEHVPDLQRIALHSNASEPLRIYRFDVPLPPVCRAGSQIEANVDMGELPDDFDDAARQRLGRRCVIYTSNVMMCRYSRCCREHRQDDRENGVPSHHLVENTPKSKELRLEHYLLHMIAELATQWRLPAITTRLSATGADPRALPTAITAPAHNVAA